MSHAQRSLRLLLGLALFAAGCGDDPAKPDPGEALAAVRLEVGGQLIEASADGAVSGQPIRLQPVTGVELRATFLRADGTPEPKITTLDYNLQITPGSPMVQFLPSGAFAGTLRANNERGVSAIAVQLLRAGRVTPVFGPFSVAVHVQ